MASKCPYTPTKDAPYAPKAVLQRRFEAKTVEDANGCLIWTGAHANGPNGKPDEGQVYVCAGIGVYKTLAATRVSWWLEGNPWPEAGAQLRHTCKVKMCVRAAHLRLVTLDERRRLTPAQKKEIARLYAIRVAAMKQAFGKLGSGRLPSPVMLTAKRAWMTVETVNRFLRGEPMKPQHWLVKTSVEELRSVYQQALKETNEQRRLLAETEAYTVTNLSKTYGVSLSTITRACSD